MQWVATLATCAPTPGAEPAPDRAQLLGSYVWTESWEGFGGVSALELDPDGTTFIALSDRTLAIRGRLSRDATGAVSGVEILSREPLRDPQGHPLSRGRGDSEGLALAPDGTPVAKGLAAFDAGDARALVGRKTDEIEAVLGYRGRAEMVHRDDLVLL